MKYSKLVCYALGAFWFGIILACGGGQHPAVRGETSAAVSQNLWERCINSIRSAQCSSSGDMVYQSICLRSIGDEYFALQSFPERQNHLISYGCPPAIVQASR
ncbi:MAG: hypothetical protein WC761_01690 [Candidatus Paceibacterota bacterium]|jgi:hypothetical protein